MILKKLTNIILLCLASTLYADMSKFYEIIIDVGSTGSRIHIYSVEPDDQLPKIEQIFYHSVEPGFSTFANEPNQIPFYLSRLFNPAQKFCYTEKLPCQDIPIYFLSTAGMRLLPQGVQKNMYNSVETWLQDNTLFGEIKEIRTISGKNEAAYGWLESYEDRIRNKEPLGAFFELGGASMQYAFVVDKPEDSNHIIRLPDRSIFLNLGSWLGFGSNEAVRRVTSYWQNSKLLCYPKDYKSSSDFSYKSCFNLFKHYLEVNEDAAPEKEAVANAVKQNEPIIMVANFRTLFEFFGTLDPGQIHNQLKSTCELDWKTLRHKNPLVNPDALGNFCVEGTYVMSLFDAFGLPSQYAHYSIPYNSWTRGVVIHHWSQLNAQHAQA